MSSITIDVPNEMYSELEEAAAKRKVSIETFIRDTLTEMMKQFEAHQLFLKMSRRGESEVAEAIELLRR